MTKVTLDEARKDFDILGQFVAARERGDKSQILRVIQKVDGRVSIELIKRSDLTWLQHVVRWFGFGGTTLKDVSSYLVSYCPRLPPEFSRGSMVQEFWAEHYSDLSQTSALEKADYKTMKMAKLRAIDQIQSCIARLQKKSYWVSRTIFSIMDPVFANHEKIDLRTHSDSQQIGHFSHEQKSADNIRLKYQITTLDTEKGFPNWNVAGYCYEHGIKVAQDDKQAYECYVKALIKSQYHKHPTEGRVHFATWINLARLQLRQGDTLSAIENFTRAERVLSGLIQEFRDIKALDPQVAFLSQWAGGVYDTQRALQLCEKVQKKVTEELKLLA